ncbi:hypothetical protein [Flavisphingomonas formosensis]|uniref:hypothetical protein n=1 Tax=Flavisphingomonas formosensis TaxID=861534 RepID=UPI0018DF4ACD|nr:hypothetical protein [Sphingomonas formosensis]
MRSGKWSAVRERRCGAVAIMPSGAYLACMTAPQLSVRSARARDLAHRLSRLERRPIHAIVEDALTEYAKRHPEPSASAFLKRLRVLAVEDVDLEALIEDNRTSHDGVAL